MPIPSPTIPSCVSTLVERLASRIIVFFVRHAALLRPLSQSGRLQVAKDLAELQLSVGQHLYPVEQLGAPYRMLRAFRTLLFADASALLAGTAAIGDLPASIVMHHLFSRLPSEIKAPQQEDGALSIHQYSSWLDQHSAEDVAGRVRTALEVSGPAADAAAQQLEGGSAVLEVIRKLSSL